MKSRFRAGQSFCARLAFFLALVSSPAFARELRIYDSRDIDSGSVSVPLLVARSERPDQVFFSGAKTPWSSQRPSTSEASNSIVATETLIGTQWSGAVPYNPQALDEFVRTFSGKVIACKARGWEPLLVSATLIGAPLALIGLEAIAPFNPLSRSLRNFLINRRFSTSIGWFMGPAYVYAATVTALIALVQLHEAKNPAERTIMLSPLTAQVLEAVSDWVSLPEEAGSVSALNLAELPLSTPAQKSEISRLVENINRSLVAFSAWQGGGLQADVSCVSR